METLSVLLDLQYAPPCDWFIDCFMLDIHSARPIKPHRYRFCESASKLQHQLQVSPATSLPWSQSGPKFSPSNASPVELALELVSSRQL